MKIHHLHLAIAVLLLFANSSVAFAEESEFSPLSIKIPCGGPPVKVSAENILGVATGLYGDSTGPFRSEQAARRNSQGVCNYKVHECETEVCPMADAQAISLCETIIEFRFHSDRYKCSAELSENPICHNPPYLGCEKEKQGYVNGGCKVHDDPHRVYEGHTYYDRFAHVYEVNGEWYFQCGCNCQRKASGTLLMGCSDCKPIVD